MTAAHHVAVLIHDAQANVVGGQQTHVARATPKEWCEYYGVPVDDDGVAVLYKALDDDFRSPHGMSYAPGTKPVASDWDGLARECGGGLHFSPRPLMAKEFHEAATKYAACPVRLADIVVHPDADYPQKVKARACCAPVWECDDLGHPIGPTTI